MNGEEGGSDKKHIPVMESATGAIVSGVQAPIAENLEDFLAANPGWEILPEEDTDSSDDDNIRHEGESEGESKYYEIIDLDVFFPFSLLLLKVRRHADIYYD